SVEREMRDPPRWQNPARQTENAEGNESLFFAEHTQAISRSQVRKPKKATVRAHRKRQDEPGRNNPLRDRRIEETRLCRDGELPALPAARSPSRLGVTNPKCFPPRPCSPGSLLKSLPRSVTCDGPAARTIIRRDTGALRFPPRWSAGKPFPDGMPRNFPSFAPNYALDFQSIREANSSASQRFL